jgi:hypothetical protein
MNKKFNMSRIAALALALALTSCAVGLSPRETKESTAPNFQVFAQRFAELIESGDQVALAAC